MQSMSETSREAVERLRGAGDLARRWFERGRLDVETKSDGTPVTNADKEVEDALRRSLHDAFPDDGLYGEEFPEQEGSSGRRWIIDPIDGTKSFIHGIPLYSTLLAMEEDGVATFGAIYCPSLDLLVAAERGAGCWRGDERLRVSTREDLDGAYVMATWLEDWRGDVIDRTHERGVVLRTWGDAFGYAMVASGDVDACVDFNALIHDLAPISVIISEAGGRFTGLNGQDGYEHGTGIGTNGLLHEQVRELVTGGAA